MEVLLKKIFGRHTCLIKENFEFACMCPNFKRVAVRRGGRRALLFSEPVTSVENIEAFYQFISYQVSIHSFLVSALKYSGELYLVSFSFLYTPSLELSAPCFELFLLQTY